MASRGGRASRPFRALHGGADGQVVDRPDVRPAQREQQVDLRRPAADPLELDQPDDRRLVVLTGEGLQVDAPGQHVLGQGPAIADLLAAEPDPLECRLVQRQEAFGRQRVGRRQQAADDRPRRLGRDLLRGHDRQQSGKTRRTAALGRQAAVRIGAGDVCIARGQHVQGRAQGFVGRRVAVHRNYLAFHKPRRQDFPLTRKLINLSGPRGGARVGRSRGRAGKDL